MVIHPILKAPKAPRDALGAGFLAPGLGAAAEAVRLALGQVRDPGAPNGAGPGRLFPTQRSPLKSSDSL